MSTPNQGTLPTPEAAYNHLYDNVHARVFFTKLAAVHGIPAETPQQQYELLQLAGRLRHFHQAEKAAEVSPYAGALQNLDQVMSASGMDQPMQAARWQEQELGIKQAALDAMADPTNYNAILALKSAEAAAVADQLGIAQ